jgi:hypothetical protein
LSTGYVSRLDEDERGVREWTRPRADGLLTSSLRDIHEWTERAGPARVLREVEALRVIINEHTPGTDVCDAHDAALETVPCPTLLTVAAIYSDRPGYQEDWRPA